jgi:hypothetical protein
MSEQSMKHTAGRWLTSRQPGGLWVADRINPNSPGGLDRLPKQGCFGSEAQAFAAIAEFEADEKAAILGALQNLDKAAMDVVWAQNQHEARVAVQWLSEACKESRDAILKATGTSA